MGCAARHLFYLFFFNAPATTEIYTLSLHDALPIAPAMTASLGSSTTPEIVYAGFRVAGATSAGDTCELAAIGPNTSAQMKALLTIPAIRKLCWFKPLRTLSLPRKISDQIQSSAAELAGGLLPCKRRPHSATGPCALRLIRTKETKTSAIVEPPQNDFGGEQARW